MVKVEKIQRPIYVLFLHEVIVLDYNLVTFKEALVVFALLSSQKVVRLAQVQSHFLQQTRHHGSSGAMHAEHHHTLHAARYLLPGTASLGLKNQSLLARRIWSSGLVAGAAASGVDVNQASEYDSSHH